MPRPWLLSGWLSCSPCPSVLLMPMPSLIWPLAWLLNRLPPACARFAPRVVVEAAYRQLNRKRLER